MGAPIGSPGVPTRGRVAVVALLVILLAAIPSGTSINHRASTTVTPASTATVTLDTPAGVVAGDALVAGIAYDDGTDITVTPDQAGWTHATGTDVQSGKKVGLAVYTRVATASEPASYSWTLSPASFATGTILAYQGVVSSPIDGTPTTAAASSGSFPITAPTTTVDDAMLVGFWAAGASAAVTRPPEMTSRQSGSGGGGPSQVAFVAADEAQPTAGSVGTRTATSSSPGNTDYAAVMLALKPPSVSFAQASSTVAESDGTVSVSVALSEAVTADVTVDYAATDVTTSGAGDYSLVGTGTLTISAGSSAGMIQLSLVDDSKGEDSEGVQLTLSNPVGAYLGATTAHTLTITDADPHILTFSDPFDVNGDALAAGTPWGGWGENPGAVNVTSTNYVKVVNNGPDANQNFILDFSGASFVATGDPSATIAIDGNIEFAAWEDATPSSTAPSEGSFTFGGTADADGAIQVAFNGLDRVVWIQYQVDQLSAILPDDSYRASYTIDPVP